ncbi:MAG: hypothetical protein Q8Q33_10000 [Chlamydiota bacterium]|nr:hypothetical protein [Chlamydiota bacterium]
MKTNQALIVTLTLSILCVHTQLYAGKSTQTLLSMNTQKPALQIKKSSTNLYKPQKLQPVSNINVSKNVLIPNKAPIASIKTKNTIPQRVQIKQIPAKSIPIKRLVISKPVLKKDRPSNINRTISNVNTLHLSKKLDLQSKISSGKDWSKAYNKLLQKKLLPENIQNNTRAENSFQSPALNQNFSQNFENILSQKLNPAKDLDVSNVSSRLDGKPRISIEVKDRLEGLNDAQAVHDEMGLDVGENHSSLTDPATGEAFSMGRKSSFTNRATGESFSLGHKTSIMDSITGNSSGSSNPSNRLSRFSSNRSSRNNTQSSFTNPITGQTVRTGRSNSQSSNDDKAAARQAGQAGRARAMEGDPDSDDTTQDTSNESTSTNTGDTTQDNNKEATPVNTDPNSSEYEVDGDHTVVLGTDLSFNEMWAGVAGTTQTINGVDYTGGFVAGTDQPALIVHDPESGLSITYIKRNSGTTPRPDMPAPEDWHPVDDNKVNNGDGYMPAPEDWRGPASKEESALDNSKAAYRPAPDDTGTPDPVVGSNGNAPSSLNINIASTPSPDGVNGGGLASHGSAIQSVNVQQQHFVETSPSVENKLPSVQLEHKIY